MCLRSLCRMLCCRRRCCHRTSASAILDLQSWLSPHCLALICVCYRSPPEPFCGWVPPPLSFHALLSRRRLSLPGTVTSANEKTLTKISFSACHVIFKGLTILETYHYTTTALHYYSTTALQHSVLQLNNWSLWYETISYTILFILVK